ncbi:hypothetical protein D3C78_838720 [compost metagenome]
MTGRGLETDVIVVGIVLGTLVVQRGIDIAFPDQVLDHRLGLHDLLDAGKLYSLGRLTVGQGHLARLGGLQRLGPLAVVGVLLDQQLLVALQGLDLLPVQRDGTTVRGLQQQLATIEDPNLAAQAVTVLHPHGVGERRSSAQGSGQQAQQGSRMHKRNTGSIRRMSRALSGCGRPEQGKTPHYGVEFNTHLP